MLRRGGVAARNGVGIKKRLEPVEVPALLVSNPHRSGPEQLRSQQLAQHERQDAAMLVVVDFDRGVDTQQHLHVLRRAVFTVNNEGG